MYARYGTLAINLSVHLGMRCGGITTGINIFREQLSTVVTTEFVKYNVAVSWEISSIVRSFRGHSIMVRKVCSIELVKSKIEAQIENKFKTCVFEIRRTKVLLYR